MFLQWAEHCQPAQGSARACIDTHENDNQARAILEANVALIFCLCRSSWGHQPGMSLIDLWLR